MAAAAPYSTGGGGVTLEHRYAATLVAAVITGSPLAELGDGVPYRVDLQASDQSPVDDVVIVGHAADGEVVEAAVGVRRKPKFVRSDTDSIPLIGAFFDAVIDRWDDVARGRFSVVLAVGESTSAVQQLKALAVIARGAGSGEAFRSAVSRPGAANAAVRKRLEHLDDLTELAAQDASPSVKSVDADELTWRWLHALRVRDLRLEGVDTTDRTHSVSMLRSAVPESAVGEAERVYTRLAELSGTWASVGAHVDEAVARRALVGHSVGRSPRHHLAWSVLDGLETRLRQAVSPDLQDGSDRLEVERDVVRAELVEAATAAGTETGFLVITGEPDVGKSALALRAAETMRSAGAIVITLSLRDLPATTMELEARLEGPLGEILAGAPTAAVRLLLIDGGEAILEGRADLFRDLALAANQAGIGVAVVTRTDGAAGAVAALSRVVAASGSSRSVERHSIPPLRAEDREQVVAAFPRLARLTRAETSAWLLGRPGLVDVLLKADDAAIGGEVLCEADVFSAVWNGIVRRHDDRADGVTAEQREAALHSIVLAHLGTAPRDTAAVAALSGLRSDGVLRTPDNAALSSGTEFASDLMRDFALCRLVLTTGIEPLLAADSPRWALRAVRMACQAMLVAQGAGGWQEVKALTSRLARSHGERWAEVPYEAVLTLGDAEPGLDHLMTEFEADDHAGLKTLVRLANQRFVEGTVGDAVALAPVVTSVFCDRPSGARRTLGRALGEAIEETVLAWLRGMAVDRAPANDRRARVRDTILADEPPHYDEFSLEAIGLLGADIDDSAERWLRAVADDGAGYLGRMIESPFVAVSISSSRPELLLHLAHSYYIEIADGDDLYGYGRPFDDGIRDTHHGHTFGFGPPFAAHYYGPFWQLLQVAAQSTVGLINDMLDHAARIRVAPEHAPIRPTALEGLPGVEIDIAGIGPRRYVGDSSVWGWYRATTVGPYVCMSALMAVERFMDYVVENTQADLERVVQFLLTECHNLAMPALVMGMLIRHGEAAHRLLDGWLASPEVWSLEHGRTVRESTGFRIAPQDGPEVVGHERRRMSPREVVAEMVLTAAAASDDDRLDELTQVGNRLVVAAEAALPDSADRDGQLMTVRGWAATFDIDNYGLAEIDGSSVIVFEPPGEIAEYGREFRDTASRGSEAVRLQTVYAGRYEELDDHPAEALAADLAVARDLSAEPPAFSAPLDPRDPLAGVAAACVRRHADGTFVMGTQDLQWAAAQLADAAVHPPSSDFDVEASTYPYGADRSAARALPVITTIPSSTHGLSADVLARALDAVATSMFSEVRAEFVLGATAVWHANCSTRKHSGVGCAVHGPVWKALQSGLRDCRLGTFDPQLQRRPPLTLQEPYAESLALVGPEDLRLHRIAPVLAGAVEARAAQCLHDPASELLPALWDAHRRGMVIRETPATGGHHDDRLGRMVARALITETVAGRTEPLREHATASASHAVPLQVLASSLVDVFSYEAQHRDHIEPVWTTFLGAALDSFDASVTHERTWGDYAVAGLLPTPSIRTADRNPDATLTEARASWLRPDAIAGLADRWIQIAAGIPKAADAVADFARTADTAWQVQQGLDWLERVIDDRYSTFAGQCWPVTDWLESLRQQTELRGDGLRRWLRIVDGLAAGGDASAARLQRIDE